MIDYSRGEHNSRLEWKRYHPNSPKADKKLKDEGFNTPQHDVYLHPEVVKTFNTFINEIFKKQLDYLLTFISHNAEHIVAKLFNIRPTPKGHMLATFGPRNNFHVLWTIDRRTSYVLVLDI